MSTSPILLRQGLNYRLYDRQIGVMNIYKRSESMVAQLAIFDPATSRDETVTVAEGDQFSVGEQRCRVARIIPETDRERAALEMLPMDPP